MVPNHENSTSQHQGNTGSYHDNHHQLNSYRFVFTQGYDLNYLEDFYNNSQWVVPQSPRIMGDGELYSYAAGTLLQGDDPFRVNPETPPLGKYIYSLSILIFSNPLIF